MSVMRTMIKDTYLKLLFIPLIGLSIPFLARLSEPREAALSTTLLAAAVFIFCSHLIWNGTIRIVFHFRRSAGLVNFSLRLIFISILSGLFGAAVMALAAFLWLHYRESGQIWTPVRAAGLMAFFSSMFIGLLYELIFLKKEHEVKSRVIQCLDHDLIHAEGAVMQHTLEPHFLFNALSALSYLIHEDTARAQSYIQSLSSVYKYMLVNRDRNLVRLDEELRFVDAYLSLLRIRYGNTLVIDNRLESKDCQCMVVPFSLQILLENAIKHNSFCQKQPLTIRIFQEERYIVVENTLQPRLESPDSTKLGLEHLRVRYELQGQHPVVVRKDSHLFTVRIPFFKTS